MIGIILAGGRGDRMQQNTEKPLLEIGGLKMLDLVMNAAKRSELRKVFIAVSPNTPATKKYCSKKRIPFIETRGKGYHEDLADLLNKYSSFVSIASDIPFLKSDTVDTLIKAYDGASITGCISLELVPEGVKTAYVIECDRKLYVAIGVNVVTNLKRSKIVVLNDPLLGINVNTIGELEVARRIFENKP